MLLYQVFNVIAFHCDTFYNEIDIVVKYQTPKLSFVSVGNKAKFYLSVTRCKLGHRTNHRRACVVAER